MLAYHLPGLLNSYILVVADDSILNLGGPRILVKIVAFGAYLRLTSA